jgi:hypothetical protein
MSGPWERFRRPATQASNGQPVQNSGGAAPVTPGQTKGSDAPAPTGQEEYSGPPLLDSYRYDRDQGFVRSPALRAAQESELPGPGDGRADAFRHVLLAAELTRRYGPDLALLLLNQHESNEERTPGWERQAEDMDKHNNAIGIDIGRTARDYPDVVQQVQAIIAASSPDGSGTWKDPRHHLSAPAPVWLPRDKWFGRSEKNNWYDNPEHPGSLAFPQTWPHMKDYRYGSSEERYRGWLSFNTLLGYLAYLHEQPAPKQPLWPAMRFP